MANVVAITAAKKQKEVAQIAPADRLPVWENAVDFQAALHHVPSAQNKASSQAPVIQHQGPSTLASVERMSCGTTINGN